MFQPAGVRGARRRRPVAAPRPADRTAVAEHLSRRRCAAWRTHMDTQTGWDALRQQTRRLDVAEAGTCVSEAVWHVCVCAVRCVCARVCVCARARVCGSRPAQDRAQRKTVPAGPGSQGTGSQSTRCDATSDHDAESPAGRGPGGRRPYFSNSRGVTTSGEYL